MRSGGEIWTLDASVHLNALNPTEGGTEASQAFLECIFGRPGPVFSPTLLLVEVAAAVARTLNDSERGWTVAQTVRHLPGQIWVGLDDDLAEESARLAAERRLRGADAVYAAVARRHGATLVTCDLQQIDRLQAFLPVLRPAQALGSLTQ